MLLKCRSVRRKLTGKSKDPAEVNTEGDLHDETEDHEDQREAAVDALVLGVLLQKWHGDESVARREVHDRFYHDRHRGKRFEEAYVNAINSTKQ
jgi:hypothetical protein